MGKKNWLMTEEEGDALIYANFIHEKNGGNIQKTKSEFLESQHSKFWNKIKNCIEPIKDDGGTTIADISGDIEQPEAWYKNPEVNDDSYWQRYLELLIRKGWYEAINDIRSSTRDLIDRIPDPNKDKMDVYGLVVGRVQSGKTANFTGLIARAVDSGYNLVIVLSGTLNNLRNQTQKRLLRELTGHEKHPKGLHVRKPNNKDREFELLTDVGDTDFVGGDINIFYNDRPKLAVIKKNVQILIKLKQWLEKLPEKKREQINLLIIDDEADYASVNRTDKRAENEELRASEDDFIFEEEDLEASRTNAYLRGILKIFPNRAYIGYTATPYANVMIDPNEDDAKFDFGDGDERLGKTLYPRNFIRLLERPKNYVGLDEIFPEITMSELTHVESVSKIEQDRIRQGFLNIDEKLTQALATFIVTGAIKKVTVAPEEWQNTHHTMMVHVTHAVKIMKPLARHIDNKLNEWKMDIEEDWEIAYDLLVEKLRVIWNNHTERDFDLEAIKSFLNDIKNTMLINSEKDEQDDEKLIRELDFDSKRVIGVIIGGNLLSRGLTVEGLSISYFIRSCSTYESAIQMCRWNGIRTPLEKDMIKVFLTKEMIEDYQWLNVVEKDLRSEVMHYADTNKSPTDFAVRILRYYVEGKVRMTPTSRGKMVNVKVVNKGIHRTIQQSRAFLKYTDNSTITRNFVDKLNFKKMNINDKEIGHYHAKNVDFSEVWNFLGKLEMHPYSNKEGILGYFNHVHKENNKKLQKWSVIIIGGLNNKGDKLDLGNDIEIKMPTRTRTSDIEEDEEFFTIPELATDIHLSLDLQPSENLINESGKYERNLMWEERPDDSPLLLLYLLDPRFKKNEKTPTYFDENDKNIPEFILAPVVVLPDAKLTKEERKELRSYYRLENMPGSER